MTVRLFVTSASLMIFSWLATTYLRAVPMDTYPTAPGLAFAPSEQPVSISAPGPQEEPSVRLIATGATGATQ